ncbi:hypothetical protein GCM10010431_81800 [Streptomyces kunmingensis]
MRRAGMDWSMSGAGRCSGAGAGSVARIGFQVGDPAMSVSSCWVRGRGGCGLRCGEFDSAGSDGVGGADEVGGAFEVGGASGAVDTEIAS